jgi:hypothetical protein
MKRLLLDSFAATFSGPRDVAGTVAALGEGLDGPEHWASMLGVEDGWKLPSG